MGSYRRTCVLLQAPHVCLRRERWVRKRERRSDHPGNQRVIPMVTVIEVLCMGYESAGAARDRISYIVARDALHKK
jgi:hypothetical protein